MSQSAASDGYSGSNLRRYLRSAFITGAAITVPVLVTLVVLIFAIDFLAGILNPAVVLIQEPLGFGQELPDVVVAFIALLIILLVMLLVGLAAESSYSSGRLEHRMETAITSIPGIGSIYDSVHDISEMLLDRDTESFREVKLVEYPSQGAYSLVFLTADRADKLTDVTGEGEMVTVFMPMAPNPMGGFLIHVPTDRVYDVDLTVEEGVQAILSTGVTLEGSDGEEDPEEAADDRPTPAEGEDDWQDSPTGSGHRETTG